MATTRRNQSVSIQSIDGDTVTVLVDGINQVQYSISALANMTSTDYLQCLLAAAADQKSLALETATLAQFKSALDGNYKI